MTKLKRLLVRFAVMMTTACGSSSSTAPTSNTFHAEVTDPAGDAVASVGVSNPPDLVHGTVDLSGGAVTFTIQFASGTFEGQSTYLTIQLDTDQTPSTGINGGAIGIDYILSLRGSSNQTGIQQALPASCAASGPCYADVGVAALSVGTDSMTTTVPLAALGNASGRLNYRVFAYFLPQSTTTVIADTMPDITLPPAHVP